MDRVMDELIDSSSEMEIQIKNLLSERSEMIKNIVEMELFFGKLSEAIIQKCVTRITRKIRKLGKESPDINFLADDYEHLDLFEQISLVAMPGDIHVYLGVDEMIYNFSKSEYETLIESDKFILNHQETDNAEYCAIDDIKSHFVKYATDYTNKKLEKYR